MAASSVSIATSSGVDINVPASLGGEEADSVASDQTSGQEMNDTAAMLDYPEYWIG
jgi:hypothetical protein